jgi:hypothetical protein
MLLTLFVTFFQPIIFSTQALYASAIVLAPLASFICYGYASPKQLLLPNVLFWISAGLIVYNHLL